MASTSKTVAVNYTEAQTAEMVKKYSSAPERATVEALALSMGKSVRSIVAKLSREKVYVKPVAVSKTGGAIVKKGELIDSLTEKVELTEAEATSFEHVNKTALQKLLAALENVTIEEDFVTHSEVE